MSAGGDASVKPVSDFVVSSNTGCLLCCFSCAPAQVILTLSCLPLCLQSEIGFGKLETYIKLDKLGEVRPHYLLLSVDVRRYLFNKEHKQHLSAPCCTVTLLKGVITDLLTTCKVFWPFLQIKCKKLHLAVLFLLYVWFWLQKSINKIPTAQMPRLSPVCVSPVCRGPMPQCIKVGVNWLKTSWLWRKLDWNMKKELRVLQSEKVLQY